MRKKKDKPEDVEIDVAELAKSMIDQVFEAQNLYFKCVEEISETQKYTELIGTKMFKLDMIDQLKLMTLLAQAGKTSKELCEKYGFELEEEDI